MKLFKRLIILAGLLCLAGSARSGYYGSGGKDHGHTGAGDGGVLSNPTITGGSPHFDAISVGTRTLAATSHVVAGKSVNQITPFTVPIFARIATFTATTDLLSEWNGSTFTSTSNQTLTVSAIFTLGNGNYLTGNTYGVTEETWYTPYIYKNGVALVTGASRAIAWPATTASVSISSSFAVSANDKVSIRLYVFDSYLLNGVETIVSPDAILASGAALSIVGGGASPTYNSVGGITFADGTTMVSATTATFSVAAGTITIQGGITVNGTTTLNGPLASPLVSNYGGTGADLSASSTGSVSYATSNGVFGALTPGTSGYYLKTRGSGLSPEWAAVSSGVPDPLTVGTVQSAVGSVLTLKSQSQTANDTKGDNVAITAGDGGPTSEFPPGGAGGDIVLTPGTGGSSGVSGHVYIEPKTGTGHVLDATDGSVTVGGGSAMNNIIFQSAQAGYLKFPNGVLVSTTSAAMSGGGVGIGANNALFIVGGSTTTAAGTNTLGTNAPSSVTTPAYWVTVRRCKLNNTSCTTGYMPVWE